MKKVLVTGSTGFIGNYVIQQLLASNCVVIATSSNAEKAKRASWFSSVKYIPLDFKQLDSAVNYYDYFERPDILIHLAWEGLPNYKSAFHIEENLPRHYLFIKNCVEHGLNDVTVTGTCLEYGMQEGCLSEEMPAKPSNPYAIAKDKLRKLLEELQKQKTFSLKWVRLFYMYGTGQSASSLLSQLNKALENKEPVFNMSGGQQERDYLPVEQVARNIIAVALQTKETGVINCSTGHPITVEKFVRDHLAARQQQIALNLGYYPYTDYEPMRFWGDNQKLRRVLNHTPAIKD